ncbi:MAG: DNA mismatch repair endonuclease MutL [Nitrospinota bacterium]|nr:DNA mismatch repair endonuclease MutL [Nitrospinota bacterium]
MDSASRIRVLPENLANKIAAGEVVQRPASALKELIENSLDAGARSIFVDLESGGARRIRVRDDGEGMGRDDALLAFERHATSKISSEKDLHAVVTLGFRGEALPSIAAVSKVVLTTRRRGEPLGSEVRLEGGRMIRAVDMGAPEGTEIDIRSLFFNVPARRKFLKTKNTELARCAEVVSRAAMAHPGTSFVLRHGDRTLFDLKPTEKRLERAAELLGKESLPHLIEIPGAERDGIRLGGWAGAPTLTRSNRESQYFFVNGRPVRDRLLVHAISKAYRSFLPNGRHPVFSLFLEAAPEEVDVNVHPGKEEVRFRRGGVVHDFVHESVMSRLGSPPRRPRLIAHKPNGLGIPMPPLGASRPSGGRGPDLLGGGGYIPRMDSGAETLVREESPLPAEGPLPAHGPFPAVAAGVSPVDDISPLNAGPDRLSADEVAAEDPAFRQLPHGSFPLDRVLVPPDPSCPVRLSECRYMGQWAECFLLFESNQGLVFVDQHAAHERVLYNRFWGQFRTGVVERQAALVPQSISLRPEEALRLDEHAETLERSGFELESVGVGEYLVRAVPALLADRDPAGAVRRVVEGLADLDEPMSFPDLIDGIIARMSCKGAVKAAHSLHPEEVASLVEEIDKTPGRWTCPHGRPIMLLMTEGPVRRRFLR